MKNLVRNGKTFIVPGPVASGDPVAVGQLSGVASASAETGETVAAEKSGVYSLSVAAVGTDIVAGDEIYYHAAGDPKLNNTSASGVLFGYADAEITTITADSTATINVMLKG